MPQALGELLYANPLHCLPVTFQVGFFDDKVGPITVAVIVGLSLLAIFISALKDVLSG